MHVTWRVGFPCMSVEKLWNSVPDSSFTCLLTYQTATGSGPIPGPEPHLTARFSRALVGLTGHRWEGTYLSVLPKVFSQHNTTPPPAPLVVHLPFISSLWENHKISQGLLLPQTGWEARSTPGSRVNDLG